GKGNDVCRRTAAWFQEQSLSGHTLENWPTHLKDPVRLGFRHERRSGIGAEALEPAGCSRVHRADFFDKPSPIGGDGLFVLFPRRKVAMPVPPPGLDRLRDLALHEAVRAIHHADRKVVVPVQWAGSRERHWLRRNETNGAEERNQ